MGRSFFVTSVLFASLQALFPATSLFVETAAPAAMPTVVTEAVVVEAIVASRAGNPAAAFAVSRFRTVVDGLQDLIQRQPFAGALENLRRCPRMLRPFSMTAF